MKIICLSVPISVFFIILYIKLVFPDAYILLIREDSVIEYMQFLFYFISSVISSFISIKLLRNKMTLHGVLHGILTVGLLLVSLEEISWGQRFFDIATPDYFEQHNVQNEISLHNLGVVQPLLHKAYILTGAYGAFAWIFVYLFLPEAKATFRHIVNFVVPDWFVSPNFFFGFFIYIILEYVSPPHRGSFIVWRDQEPVELLLSLGFLSFLVTNYVRLQICLTSASIASGRHTNGARR